MADEKLTEEARTEPKEPRQVSRRRFLFGSGLAVGGAVAAGIAGPVLGPATPAKASDALASPATGEAVPALQKAMGYVSYDPTNCAGCRSCMAVCSLYHEGVVNP